MKDWQRLKGKAQKEALINELKGNLFEYLLASLMARHFHRESEFLHHFASLGEGKFFGAFQEYQRWLLENDRLLYERLPTLALETFSYLLERTPFFHGFSVENIFLTGKWISGGESEQALLLKESDIVVVNKEKEHRGLSLKLCKKGSFVNTKSGGIRSFIEKYFGDFSLAKKFQAKLNEKLEKSFYEMSYEMYQWADLPPSSLSEKGTQFSSLWEEQGLPTLPGQLEEGPRRILHAHYQRVIAALHSFLKELWEGDQKLFAKCLYPLMGLGSREIGQLTCFHTEKKALRYEVDSFKYRDFSSSFSSSSFSLLSFLSSWPPLKPEVASFEFNLGDQLLQIRVKPMNTFTVSGLKVNCSLKSLLEKTY